MNGVGTEKGLQNQQSKERTLSLGSGGALRGRFSLEGDTEIVTPFRSVCSRVIKVCSQAKQREQRERAAARRIKYKLHKTQTGGGVHTHARTVVDEERWNLCFDFLLLLTIIRTAINYVDLNFSTRPGTGIVRAPKKIEKTKMPAFGKKGCVILEATGNKTKTKQQQQ